MICRRWKWPRGCDNPGHHNSRRNKYLVYHSITEFVFLMNIFGKRSTEPFSRKSDRKKDNEKNIICSQTKLDDIAHEQTIICRQLFAGHVVSSLPMKRKKNLQRRINTKWMSLLGPELLLGQRAWLKWFQDQRAYKSRDSRYQKNTDTFKSPFILALTEGRNNRCHVPKTFSERKSMKLSWDVKRRKFRITINTNKFSCGEAYLHVNFTCNAASTTCNNWSGKQTRNPLLYKNVFRA